MLPWKNPLQKKKSHSDAGCIARESGFLLIILARGTLSLYIYTFPVNSLHRGRMTVCGGLKGKETIKNRCQHIAYFLSLSSRLNENRRKVDLLYLCPPAQQARWYLWFRFKWSTKWMGHSRTFHSCKKSKVYVYKTIFPSDQTQCLLTMYIHFYADFFAEKNFVFCFFDKEAIWTKFSIQYILFVI